MKKVIVLISLMFLMNGCAESVALLGTSAGGASSGKMFESSINTAISYGIKNETGKTPIGHALAYVEDKKSVKNKKISKIKNEKKLDSSSNKITLSMQSIIDQKFKINYLDN